MSPMTIAWETVRNDGLKFCTKRDLFAYQWVDLFLLIFFQLHLLWTSWVFSSYFMILKILSLFGPFWFWTLTSFPEVVCLWYNPDTINMYYLLNRLKPPPWFVFFSDPAINLAYNIIQSRTKENKFYKCMQVFSLIFRQFLVISW